MVHSIVTKGLVQGLEDLEIRGGVETVQPQDQPEYWKEPWRCAVTQTPEEDY